MPFKKIIQDVSTFTGTYVNDDTLFDMVEIQLPAKDVLVTGGYFIVDSNDDELSNDECAVHFFQKNTHLPGAAGDPFNLTADQMEENGYLGCLQISRVDHADEVMPGENVITMYDLAMYGNDATQDSETPTIGDFVLTSSAIGHKVFMVGTVDGISGTNPSPSFTGASASSRIMLSLEY